MSKSRKSRDRISALINAYLREHGPIGERLPGLAPTAHVIAICLVLGACYAASTTPPEGNNYFRPLFFAVALVLFGFYVRASCLAYREGTPAADALLLSISQDTQRVSQAYKKALAEELFYRRTRSVTYQRLLQIADSVDDSAELEEAYRTEEAQAQKNEASPGFQALSAYATKAPPVSPEETKRHFPTE